MKVALLPIARGTVARAQRYPLHLRILYRTADHDGWQEGTIENISRSGILFSAERALSPDVAVDVKFVLPFGKNEHAGAEVACRGRIVRAEHGDGDARSTIAAELSDYQFMPGQAECWLPDRFER